MNLNFDIALEQFLEKEGRNFTSIGFIVNTQKEFLPGILLELYYSIQSRRKTENWLIEGTTSQNLSMMFRANPTEWLNTWVSLSYDPKNAEFRQSFADLTILFPRKWQFHTLLNYDFFLGKINNIDLYLVREAGRFQTVSDRTHTSLSEELSYSPMILTRTRLRRRPSNSP
jgi:hypothetical protein